MKKPSNNSDTTNAALVIPDVVGAVVIPGQAEGLEEHQAAAIRQAFAEAQGAAADAVRRVVRCGFLLLAQKLAMPHGNFVEWLGEHCPEIHKATGYRWMELARAASALIDCKPDARFNDVPLHALLDAPEEDLPPLARKAQRRLLEALEGKSRKEIVFDWKALAGSGGGGGGGGRKPMTVAGKAAAEKATAVETIRGWLHATTVLVDSNSLLICGEPDLLDQVGDRAQDVRSTLEEMEEGIR